MTFLLSTISRPRPGRRADVVAAAAEAKKLIDRHGVLGCRLSVAASAGELTGTMAFTLAFENGEAYGTFTDTVANDQELQALIERLDRADSPLVMEAQSLQAEIPLDRRVNRGRGSVTQTYMSRALPGRFEAVLDLTRQAFDFVEAHGAVDARLYSLVGAGSLTDVLVGSWQFENMRALGRANDAYLSAPGGQAVRELMTGPDCPITTISSAILTDIAI